MQPLTFIHVLPSHQVKSNTRLLSKVETPVPTLDSSCEPKIHKVLVCGIGKAKGTKSPASGPTSGGGALLRKGRAPAWFPEAGRKERPSDLHVGLGKFMQSGAERN